MRCWVFGFCFGLASAFAPSAASAGETYRLLDPAADSVTIYGQRRYGPHYEPASWTPDVDPSTGYPVGGFGGDIAVSSTFAVGGFVGGGYGYSPWYRGAYPWGFGTRPWYVPYSYGYGWGARYPFGPYYGYGSRFFAYRPYGIYAPWYGYRTYAGQYPWIAPYTGPVGGPAFGPVAVPGAGFEGCFSW